MSGLDGSSTTDALSRRDSLGRLLDWYCALMERNLSNFAQKAFYLGMGMASFVANKAASAADKAGVQLAELRKQAQSLVDELVERGEMSADEARVFMDGLIKQGQQGQGSKQPEDPATASGPRKINIDDMEDEVPGSLSIELTEAARLRQQINDLQMELERLKENP